MATNINVGGQGIQIWERRGFVDACSFRSRTDIWTQSAGLLVHPAHPGHVRSRVTETKEVRLTFNDNSRSTVTLDGSMTFVQDDDVSLVYASSVNASTGQLVGVINHTEGRFWEFGTRGNIRFHRSGLLKGIRPATLASLLLILGTMSPPYFWPSLFGNCFVYLFLASLIIAGWEKRRFRRSFTEYLTAEMKHIMSAGSLQRTKSRPADFKIPAQPTHAQRPAAFLAEPA